MPLQKEMFSSTLILIRDIWIVYRTIQKNNCYTPGTNIKILTEKKSRSLNPDYYLVLPWHFKREILKREKNMRRNGTKFIFPLPIIKII